MIKEQKISVPLMSPAHTNRILNIGIVGCGIRSRTVYAPVIQKMYRHFNLVSVCDVDEQKGCQLAKDLGKISYYRELEKMISNEKLDLLYIAVSPPPLSNNDEVVLKAIDLGCNILTETPIAKELDAAKKIAERCQERKIKIEFAENYYRQPFERFKQMMISEGVFGKINVVYSDFVSHGYHGISMIRSYIGFNKTAKYVTGFSNDYEVVSHRWNMEQAPINKEKWQFAVIEFTTGEHGVFSFSTISYGSPLRWGREKCNLRFYAEKGMGIGKEMIVYEGNQNYREVNIIRQIVRLGEVDSLYSYKVDVDSLGQVIEWINPLWEYSLEEKDQHDELTTGLQLLSIYNGIVLGDEVEYGVVNALLDRRIDLAMTHSWENGNAKVDIASF